MKKFMFALMGVMSLMLVACGSDDNDGGSSIKNFWTLTKESKTLAGINTNGLKKSWNTRLKPMLINKIAS